MLRGIGLDKYVPFAPKDSNASIWRYMDLAKYVSLLSKSSLYFANTLNLKDDLFEGSWPKKVLETTQQQIRENFEKLYASILESNPQDKKLLMPIEDILRTQDKYRSWEKNYTFVNCWHLGEDESFAMWKVYGAEKKAIAIRSTISLLENEIASSPSLLGFGEATDFLAIGAVKYENFDTIDDPIYNFPFTKAFLKRNGFAYENEVRVVLGKVTGRVIDPGYFVKVSLVNLIKEVRVSPGEDKWFIDIVKELTRKYGFDFLVSRTELDNAPIF